MERQNMLKISFQNMEHLNGIYILLFNELESCKL